jgi:phosphate-selective porin OprO/OprP
MKKLTIILALMSLAASAAFAQEKDNEQYNQYGVKVDIDPLQAEAQDGILVLRSKGDSGYKIWFDNRVQTDGAVYFGEQEWADGISNGLSIRRARFALKAQIDKDWYGEVDMDMADGEFELKDAIIRYTGLEHFTFQAGNFKEIFSLQRNNSSRYLQFIERPMVCSALAPSRQIGINANYYNKGIFLNLGIHGQEIAGSEERGYVEDKSKSSLGPDEGLSYTFKAVYQPGWNKPEWGMHLGAAVSYRQPKTSEETWQKARFSCRNSSNITRKKYIDTGEFSYDHVLLYTGELAGYWKGFRGEAVYMANQTYLPENGGTKPFWGWYVQGGYLLFGGHQRYDGAGAKFTRVKRGQKWGDVELCGRVEYVDLNADKALNANDQKIMGGSCMAYALGLNYYINDHVKVQLNYQYNDNDRFASGKGNKFYVGVDDAGAPTKDPYKVNGKLSGNAGVNYHMVAMRFEIDF